MSPRIHFFGASRAVTGSCYLLETGNTRVLVDCGMFQGAKSEKELNYRPFPFDPKSVHCLLLTHAHIDHTGLLPKLSRNGFSGTIHATAPTQDLCGVMLPDSGHIQESEVEQLNRRNRRRGRDEVTPIYTEEDARETLNLFKPVAMKTWLDAAPGVRARYWNAGHLLGSASIEVELTEDGHTTRILFSGDIGPENKALEPDPEAPKSFDYVLCESTYGSTDRLEVGADKRRALLTQEILKAVGAGGPLLIPSFAVERTQELLVDIYYLSQSHAIPDIPVFVDSPLATEASRVFLKYAASTDDPEDLRAALKSQWIRFTEDADESRRLSRVRGAHIIISASGMADAGRIRHHLKNWLWRPEGSVLFVGYQAMGSMGRILLDGARKVRIQGDEITVRASINSLDVYSGHADGPELAHWVEERLPVSGNVFLVHGEEASIEGLKTRLSAVMPPEKVMIPSLDDCFELTPRGAVAKAQDTVVRQGYRPQVGKLDWHNDLSQLFMDISDKARGAADEKARAALLRRLRRVLEEA
ncbi:MAG: MBL fold metallo-hydrolase [Methylobacteriaceae bacterium]|nr:MBL fold metallo-hydrolase [Methylobacteriaceae bacterium]